MRLSREDLSNLRRISVGKNVAYVDRLRLRFRGEKHFEGRGSHWPLPVSKKVEDALGSKGWEALYSPRLWLEHFPSMSAVFLNTGWGFGRDTIEASIGWFSDLVKISPPASRLGLVESVYADRLGRPHSIVKVPVSGGGHSLHEFALVAPPKIAEHLGRAVEFVSAFNSQRPRLRPISPPSAVCNGRISHLSVLELVFILEAQSEKMSFAGSWKKEPLPSVHLGKECLSEDLVALYLHCETGEGVLALRGTRPLNLMDWLINVRTTHGNETVHHRQAVATALAAKQIAPNLLLAGHSKGGGLAQYISCETGIPSVTFNSVGLPSPLAKRGAEPPPVIEHFMIKFDPVSNLGGATGETARGILGPLAALRRMDQVMQGGAGAVRLLPPPANRGQIFALHSMKSFKDVLRENPIVIPNPTSPSRARSFFVKGMVRCPDTREMIYEVDSGTFQASGKPTRKILQSNTPTLSKKRTTPSSISTTTVSKFL